MAPCKLGSSALGLTGEFSLLCAGTENMFSDLLAHDRPEKGFHHIVFHFFVPQMPWHRCEMCHMKDFFKAV